QSSKWDIQLRPAGVSEEILVTAGRAPQSGVITEDQIQSLPLNERNFIDFSLLTPGVTDARGLVTFTLPQMPTSGLSFLGQNGRSNSVTIDGVDHNDSAVGAVRATVSQGAVQEFEIHRANYSAEFGRASGGF